MRTLPFALFLFAARFAFGAVQVTQTFTLQPGWNAIHLEVEPANPNPGAVFGGLPVAMVWSYFPTRTPLEFIQNPSDGLWNTPGWNVWLPPAFPDAAVLRNLFAVQGHQPYLVKITGAVVVTLTVTGAPRYREIPWQPDGFTLTGLPLDPAVTVRSGDYFFNSAAHAAQKRYRLDPNGTWIALSDSSILQSGRAYWIFSKGASQFTGPLGLDLDATGRLDYGPAVETKQLTIRNLGATSLNATLANPSAFPLVVAGLDATGATTWTPLASLVKTVAPGAQVTLTLGVRRAGLAAESDALLVLSAQGVRRQIPVSVQNPAAGAANANSGLWIGSVTLAAVSEPHSTSPATPTATPAEFSMRLLLHVNDAGQTRLLKEVILMKQPNQPGPPPVAGALVLLSNPALIPQFTAPGNHDGAPFATRVSSIGYDFDGIDAALGGTFGGTLNGSLTIGRNAATNPFKHRYHPDHDDLTAAFATPPAGLPAQEQEVWAVTRAVQLTFGAPSAGDLSPGGGGYSRRAGTYRETVSGLHKAALITTGTFTLRRYNTLGTLNPAPTP